MKTVRQLLSEKGKGVFSVTPTQTVFDALAFMADKGVGALVVVENKKLVGMISERDYARKVILMKRGSKETLVRDIMTSKVVHATPEQNVEECMVLMTQKRFRHLPVMDDDEILGMVSIGDLVKSVIDEQKVIIDQLEQYIRS